MTRFRSIALWSVTALAAAGCGGGDEVTGKGGFQFPAGTGGGTTGTGGAGGTKPTTTPTGAGGSTCTAGAACAVAGKLGACAAGKIACGADGPSCVGPAPQKETCNGADDSCDGVTDEACEVVVEVRRFDGSSVAALTTALFPAQGKATLGLDALFGADPGDGWLSVTSSSPLPLLGLGVVVPSAAPVPTHVLSPTAAPAAAQKTVFFPGYRQGGPNGLAHAATLVNDGDQDVTATVHVLPDGAPAETAVNVVVPAHGAWRSDAGTLLGEPGKQGAGWMSVDASAPLVASFEEWSSVTDRAAETGWGAPAKKATFPIVVVGGAYETRLLLATRNQLAVSIEARLHTPSGTLGPATVLVNAGARGEATLGKDLFPGAFAAPTLGWLELAADGEVGVLAEITDGDHAGIALVAPAGALDVVHYAADAVVAEGAATHLLLGNPSDTAVGVAVEAFAADGTAVRRANVLVPASGAYAGSLSDLLGGAPFDGWLRVASEKPITGGYARHDGVTGIGATALQRGQGGRAIVPAARSLAGAERTIVTIVQPERRAFATP